MSLTYEEMYALIADVDSSLKGMQLENFEECGPSRFILVFTDGGASRRLMLSLANNFLRFHIAARNYPQNATPFTEKVIELLNHARLEKAELLNCDRILCLQFRSKEKGFRLICEFFSKAPNLLLVDGSGIQASLNKCQRAVFTPAEATRHHAFMAARFQDSSAVEEFYLAAEKQQRMEEKRKNLLQPLKRQEKKYSASLVLYRQQLQNNQVWPSLQHQADLLQAHFYLIKRGMNCVYVKDWEKDQFVTLPLDPLAEPKDNVANAFARARKMRKSLPHIEARITEVEKQLQKVHEIISAIEHAQDLFELKQLCSQYRLTFQPLTGRTITKKTDKTAHPFREYLSLSGIKIFVAKKASDNDKLTFAFAKGSDWWLHVRDYSGSHVLIKTKNKEDSPDQDAILDAALLAVNFSKAAKETQVDVCLTQRKFLSRPPKKQPGKVMISKHKVLRITQNLERLKAVLSRRVLREA